MRGVVSSSEVRLLLGLRNPLVRHPRGRSRRRAHQGRDATKSGHSTGPVHGRGFPAVFVVSCSAVLVDAGRSGSREFASGRVRVGSRPDAYGLRSSFRD